MANSGAHMRGIPFTSLAAAACAGIALWCSSGSLGVGADDPASRIGFLPALWLLPLLTISSVLIAWRVRLKASRAMPLFFLLVLALPWMPVRVPAAFLLWTGPMVVGVWIAVAVAVSTSLAASRVTRLGANAFNSALTPAAIAFAAYLAAGWSLSALIPVGDEPHYLIITQSVLNDGDIRVENNYAEVQNRDYFPFPLRPHFGAPGVNGEQYSIHAPGVSVVVAPAFAFFGYPGVVVFLGLAAALGSALLWRAAYLLTQSPHAAWFGWASAAMSVPFFFQSFVVYPDGIAATLVMFAALSLVETETNRVRLLLIGAALAILPWLHARFALVSAAFGLVLCLRILQLPDARPRLTALFAIPAASAIAWFAFFRMVYGRFDPSAPYSGDTQTSALNTLSRLPAMLFDQQFGVLPNAPIYAFGLAGVVAFARARPRLAAELALVVVPYVLLTATFRDWWGGASGPGRYQAPIALLMGLPAAWLWAATTRVSTRAAGIAALFVSVLTTAALAAVDGGRLAYNEFDGYSRFADWTTPVVDVALGLPTFVRQSADAAMVRALVWIVSLGGAVLVLRRFDGLRRAAVFAAMTPAVFAIAMMCALSVVWMLDGVAAPNSERSQAAVLEAYDDVLRPNGVILRGPEIHRAEAVLPHIAFATPARRDAVPPARTLLLMPTTVPGGIYELRWGSHASTIGRADLLIGRMARPARSWDLQSEFADGVSTLELPVSVGSLLIAAASDIPAGRMTLHPIKIWTGPLQITTEIARRAERYGSAVVFFFDLNSVFHEEPGFWLRGGREARIAAAPATRGAPLRLFLRNGAAPNVVELEIDGSRQVLEFQPGEERLIDLTGANRPGVLLRIGSRAGFRPSESNPASKDTRVLGVWVEFR